MLRRHFATASLTLVVCLMVFGTSGIAQRGGGKPPAKNKLDTKGRQMRPIQLGTSGGNVNDIANGFCCSGTLGSLVRDNRGLYILSNTHVFAGDSVDGGNDRVSRSGDAISQPGLIDSGCQAAAADYVASLAAWEQLGPGAEVDAAIAEIDPADVDNSGAILGIGTISGDTAGAFVGQAVKKTGRTTGLSRSSVSGLDATINVGYSDECAGGSFTVQFTGQIVISNRGSKFLAGGDSGSLMVENVDTNPRAVGLLYAGSSFVAIANPIQDVLNRLDVEMVGGGVPESGGTGSEGKNARAIGQGLGRAMQVKARNAARLMSVPGAVGHAVGVGAAPIIKILVEEITPGLQGAAPRELEGIPVILEEVDQVHALPSCVKKR